MIACNKAEVGKANPLSCTFLGLVVDVFGGVVRARIATWTPCTSTYSNILYYSTILYLLYQTTLLDYDNVDAYHASS